MKLAVAALFIWASCMSLCANGSEAPGETNIARCLLRMDAQVRPVTDQMFEMLDGIMDDACAGIRKLHRKQNGRWDPRYAREVLKCIDDTLISRGFVYPVAGAVDQLADGLTPFQMSATQKKSFAAQPHNRRRAPMIAQRFPGPFYALDCDTGSFVYLGVADKLNLPLRLVTIPSRNRKPGHAFVRWREGSHSLDWETMDGMVTTDESYRDKWKINSAEIKAQAALADLSRERVFGCEHYLLGLEFERRRDFQRALSELSVALDLYPQSLDARSEFAWVTATGSGLAIRNNDAAIADALFVAGLVDDPDAMDTLAAAYASAGQFDLAVKEEKAAISNSERAPRSEFAYKRRLLLYQQHKPYCRVEN